MDYKLPKAKNNNIAVQKIDKEVFIYDLNNSKAIYLNAIPAKIFNACIEQMIFKIQNTNFI